MPTIRRCCIVGCLSNSRQNPQLQFFQFPRPENPFHNLWKQACHASLSRILPFKKPVVCAMHFPPNNIGGKRLIASAVPSLRMEVPSNLKAVEQQAMVEEIERSRKCAYINAVVYEWLVRANLNPQLRGSITHGMIKEKADTAKQLIGSTTFVADNRWLNRFRETHLTGFAQKLATNQLKPIGPSLWIPDIVQDLQHLFPPTSADRADNFEDVPEQYIKHMQQYGEYEEEEDQDHSYQEHDQTYQQQQQQSHYQQQHHNTTGPYDPYAQQPNYNYDDFYYERQNQSNNSYPSPQMHPSRPSSHSPPQQRSTPTPNGGSFYPAVKRLKVDDDEIQITNGNRTEPVEDLTDGPDDVLPVGSNTNTNVQTITNGKSTPNGHSAAPSPSPKSINGGGSQTNGHVSPAFTNKELESYSQALEYLKPLEDFALFKENFRAIGLISQLDSILRKGERATVSKLEQ